MEGKYQSVSVISSHEVPSLLLCQHPAGKRTGQILTKNAVPIKRLKAKLISLLQRLRTSTKLQQLENQ